MTLGSDRMIVSFRCMMLRSRQIVIFAICPFTMPMKKIKGTNVNNVGKLSCLISVFVNFLQNIMFYS
jgi:hypothetical protein